MKILVIRFSSIGDIVLCSPVIRCLKKIPGKEVELHMLTKQKFASISHHNPHIDKVYALEDKGLKPIIAQLKQENYDYVVDLHNNLRTLRVKRTLGKPTRSFRKLNLRKWLLTALKINRMPQVHIVDRLMDAAAPLGVINDGQGLDYFIPKKDKIVVADILPQNFHGGFAAFVIGGTYPTKRLPKNKITAICQQSPMPMLLLGGPEDKETGEAIAREVGAHVYNACGAFSLNQSASLVQQARAVISHDTGLMHIATAFNKPIASVWGNTVPEFGMYPYFPGDDIGSKIFEVKGLSCRPCSKIGYHDCPKKHFRCMRDIPENEIVQWIKQFV